MVVFDQISYVSDIFPQRELLCKVWGTHGSN